MGTAHDTSAGSFSDDVQFGEEGKDELWDINGVDIDSLSGGDDRFTCRRRSRYRELQQGQEDQGPRSQQVRLNANPDYSRSRVLLMNKGRLVLGVSSR